MTEDDIKRAIINMFRNGDIEIDVKKVVGNNPFSLSDGKNYLSLKINIKRNGLKTSVYNKKIEL